MPTHLLSIQLHNMVAESRTITVNPFFLKRDAIFNLRSQAVTEDGKIHHLDYSISRVKAKPKPRKVTCKKITPSLDNAMKAVCAYFKVSASEVKGKFQGGNAVKARTVYCAIARIKMGFKLREIAETINKDHSTVTNGCRSMDRIGRTGSDQLTYQEHYRNVIQILQQEES